MRESLMTRTLRLVSVLFWTVLASCQGDPIRPEALGPDVEALLAKSSDNTVGIATNLGTLGGPKSWGQAISDAGEVVGAAWRSNCTAAAFCWASSTGMVELPRLAGSVAAPSGWGYSIHANTVVGIGFMDDVRKPAARWTRDANGKWTAHEIGTLVGDDYAYALDLTIDATGAEIVVGYSATLGTPTRAFVWTRADGTPPQEPQALPVGPDAVRSSARSVNRSRTIAGYVSDASNVSRAVVWKWNGATWETAQILPQLPGYAGHQAFAINDNGVIVGRADSPDGKIRHAVRWEPAGGDYVIHDDIGGLGGPLVEAHGINNCGQVVGSSKISSQGDWRGFVWRAGKGITELGAVSGYSASYANDINDAQPPAVAGYSSAPNGNTRAVRWQLPDSYSC